MVEKDELVCPTCHGKGKLSPTQKEGFKIMFEAMNKIFDDDKKGEVVV